MEIKFDKYMNAWRWHHKSGRSNLYKSRKTCVENMVTVLNELLEFVVGEPGNKDEDLFGFTYKEKGGDVIKLEVLIRKINET